MLTFVMAMETNPHVRQPEGGEIRLISLVDNCDPPIPPFRAASSMPD
jgi:hypothetical protein